MLEVTWTAPRLHRSVGVSQDDPLSTPINYILKKCLEVCCAVAFMLPREFDIFACRAGKVVHCCAKTRDLGPELRKLLLG